MSTLLKYDNQSTSEVTDENEEIVTGAERCLTKNNLREVNFGRSTFKRKSDPWVVELYFNKDCNKFLILVYNKEY